MFKVMLIGNDYRAREKVKNTIHWQSISAQLVCEIDFDETVFDRFCQIAPQVVIMCIDQPEPTGLELVVRLIGESPDLKLIIASEQNWDGVDAAVEQENYEGLFHTVRLDDVADSLAAAIQSLQTNTNVDYHFPEVIRDGMLELFRENRSEELKNNIEAHVAGLLACGKNGQRLVQHFLFEYIQSITTECLAHGISIERFESYVPAVVLLMKADNKRCLEEVYRLTDQVLRSASISETSESYLLIKKAKEYIREHLSDKDLCLETVSDHVCLSKSYFCKLFSQQLGGAGFNSYLNRQRIEKAKQLLSNTDLKIFEISDAVGFSHARYFNKVFKQIVGLTPSEFRHHTHE